MVAARSRAREWWLARPPAERGSLLWLMVAVVGYLVHYVVFFCWIQPFYIEDSAISFAYARNWIDGLGLVPWVGGERVEGYSNALWTFLIGILYFFGVSVWTSSKVLGGLFGCLTLGFAWGIARRALPEEPGVARYAVIAPLLLAASTQFVIWNSSGLENSLFNLCLSSGIYFLVRESTEGRKLPLSALAFFALTMTRPDGLAYAGIALFARLATGLWRRQWVATLAWVAALVLPWLAYNAWRYEYFAWPWPNTYYAKDKDFKPFVWTQNGWKQIREYFWKYGILWTLPVVALGVVGIRRWKVVAVVGLTLLIAGMVAWDGREYIPPAWRSDFTASMGQYWVHSRVWTIAGTMALIGLGAFGRPGWEARGLLWACYSFGLFFVVYSSGDWMKAYRWFSLTAVPQFCLIAVGFGVVAERLPRAAQALRGVPLGPLYAAVPVLALIGANIPRSSEFITKPETSPRDVHRRVEFMRWVQTRLEIERPTAMDVDMGAHMWYSDWRIVDMAGLIDVPIAHHKYQKAMMTEYIFEERRPEFAHVHGSWANTTKIPKIERWKDEYIEIPGYPSGKKALHIGNHVRRNLIAATRWDGPPGRVVRFGDQVRMEGWDLPAPQIAAGGELQIDSAWRVADRKDGFRVLLFLAKDDAVAWAGEVSPGYDWLPVDEWGALDFVRGNWSVDIPATVPEGVYDLGFVLLDQVSGAVIPYAGLGIGDQGFVLDATAPASARVPEADAVVPVYMNGEWRIPAAVEIVAPAVAQRHAADKSEQAVVAGAAGECADADRLWRAARHHVWKNKAWQEDAGRAGFDARVRCRLIRAEGAKEDEDRAALIDEARRIDPWSEEVNAAGRPVADRLVAAGDEARAAERWEEAYAAYRAALLADPTRAWARRYAEEARDKRLGIEDPKGPDTTASPKKSTPKKAPKKPGSSPPPTP